MKKFLLAGAVVVFAGVAATGAIAADHKGSKPAAPHHAAVIAPAKAAEHKETPRHHVAKHKASHKVAHKAHTK
jgi:hypothetical protein